MIAQLNHIQCNQGLPQANLMPSSNLALERLGGPSASMGANPLLQQSLQTGQLLAQMMVLLLTLMTNGGTASSNSGTSALSGGDAGAVSGTSGGGGGSSSTSGGSSSTSGGGSSATNGASGGGNVDPSTVKDKSGTGGLEPNAQRGLQEAHKYGLPLVSGKRSGNGTSDHDHGDAIDVGTLPIGAPSSNGGTAEMKAFAEHMRMEGKAGRLNVKYIIRDGQIASSRNNWDWRPYTYPGKTQGELDALKRSNPGEYNRLQHFDHVHVSFND